MKSPFIIILEAAFAFRNLLREFGKYKEADEIRDALIIFGVDVKDKK